MHVGDLFKELKWWQFLYTEVAMLLPCGVSCLLFWYYGFPMITLIVTMLVCYLIVPLVYIRIDKISTHNTRIVSTMANIVLDFKDQLKLGIMAFFMFGQFAFIGLYFSLKHLHFWKFDRLNFFAYPDYEVVIFSVLLVLFDPFLEEFFWRLFIQSAFKGGITYSDPHEFIKWYVGFHYALYYIFIFSVITHVFWYSLICSIPFIFISRYLSHMRSDGLVTAVLAHTGFNLGVVVILNLWYWNKWEIH